MTRTAIILAGGSGTRLWPMSTAARPKQFHRIFDNKSLLERTWERITRVVPVENIWIATNQHYRDLVLDQVPIDVSRIVGEPDRRNTAPAIATSCAMIAEAHADATIGIFPSDHWIQNEDTFVELILKAFEHAEKSNKLGTIGITPSRPATGYGYLRLGEPLDDDLYEVDSFVEKPSIEKAAQMLASGGYAWNGGMFVWTWEVFRKSMETSAPEILELALKIASTGDWKNYADMPSISIDYALMEKADRIFSVTGAFGWSDLGSWDVVANSIGSDHENVQLVDSVGVFVKRDSTKPLAVIGLDDVAVVENEDGLLVINLRKADGIRDLDF